jgi:hypothetical protein
MGIELKPCPPALSSGQLFRKIPDIRGFPLHEKLGAFFHGAKAGLYNLVAMGELIGETAALRHLIVHGHALLDHLSTVLGNLEAIPHHFDALPGDPYRR